MAELFEQGGARLGQPDAGAGGGVRRHHAGAAAVAQDGQRFAAVAAKACQRRGRHEQFLQRVHAQHAGAADGRVMDDVGAGQGAGVRGGGPQALARAADMNLRGEAIDST